MRKFMVLFLCFYVIFFSTAILSGGFYIVRRGDYAAASKAIGGLLQETGAEWSGISFPPMVGKIISRESLEIQVVGKKSCKIVQDFLKVPPNHWGYENIFVQWWDGEGRGSCY